MDQHVISASSSLANLPGSTPILIYGAFVGMLLLANVLYHSRGKH